jgi:uncharacterized protein YpbB
LLSEIAALFKDGLAPEAIAERTMRSVTTIEGHLFTLADEGEIDLEGVLSADERTQILAAAERHGRASLKVLKDTLPEGLTYFQIRLALHQA